MNVLFMNVKVFLLNSDKKLLTLLFYYHFAETRKNKVSMPDELRWVEK